MAHAQDKDGNLEYWLTCGFCDWQGLVYYVRKPPSYCSDSCKAKAYRKRKRDKLGSENSTLKRRRRENNNVKTVFLEHQAAKYLASGRSEAAQVVYSLALDIGAPIDWDAIKVQSRGLR